MVNNRNACIVIQSLEFIIAIIRFLLHKLQFMICYSDEVFHEIFGFGDYDLDRHITRWTGTGCCDGLYWSNGYQSKTVRQL